MAKRNAYQGSHFAAQPTNRGRGRGRGREQRPAQQRRKRSKAPIILLLTLLILTALGVGGVVFWRHRPVNVNVNGEERTVLKRSTLAQLYESEKPDTKPGNLVSVSGKVLEEGTGDPYSATVNGVPVTSDAAETYVLWGDENIEFADGEDAMEEYTTETKETQPKLEYQVVPGTGEKADQFQQGLVQYVKQWGRAGKTEVRHGKKSGETAEGETDEPVKNCIVVAQNITPDDGKKLVALTFDDGPSYYTEPYLEILKEKGVPATFTIIGEQVADGGPVITETAKAGHLIGSHTWSHQQMPLLDQKELQKEIGDTAKALKECTGSDVMFLRPPYGDIDTQTWLRSGGLMSVSMCWTHDSEDWALPGVDEMVENCTTNMYPGSVILMHDGGGERNQDLEALPRIIDAWKEAGYTFVTFEELMESDSSIDMSAVKKGAMPKDAVWPTELAE